MEAGEHSVFGAGLLCGDEGRPDYWGDRNPQIEMNIDPEIFSQPEESPGPLLRELEAEERQKRMRDDSPLLSLNLGEPEIPLPARKRPVYRYYMPSVKVRDAETQTDDPVLLSHCRVSIMGEMKEIGGATMEMTWTEGGLVPADPAVPRKKCAYCYRALVSDLSTRKVRYLKVAGKEVFREYCSARCRALDTTRSVDPSRASVLSPCKEKGREKK